MLNGIKKLLCIWLVLLSVPVYGSTIGDVIGRVTGTDIVSYINNNPMPSYNINGRTAIIASDLENYGFRYSYNDYLRRVDITFVGSEITPITFWRDKTTYGKTVSNVLYTDIEVYADGVKLESFNVNGLTAIYFSDLSPYGTVSYDDSLRSAFLKIDSMEMAEYTVIQDRSTAHAVKNYKWTSLNREFNCSVDILVAEYDLFRSIDRTVLGINNYAAYASADGKEVEAIADYILSQDLSEEEQITAAADFVRSMKYADDITAKGMAEYPNFPLETLFEEQGDCEDTAILLCCILRKMGINSVMLVFRSGNAVGHMAVGIEEKEWMKGTYYAYNGKNYFYTETTGGNRSIGEVPLDYRGKNAYIVEP